jgi:hypothetical protein
MKESFENWKDDPESEVDAAAGSVAEQMGDAESINLAERPLEEIKKELEAEGWRYRGLVSGTAVFEAVAEENREIKIVGTGSDRYLFEKEPEAD